MRVLKERNVNIIVLEPGDSIRLTTMDQLGRSAIYMNIGRGQSQQLITVQGGSGLIDKVYGEGWKNKCNE